MLGRFLEYSVGAQPLARFLRVLPRAGLRRHPRRRHAAGSLSRHVRRRDRDRPPRPRRAGDRGSRSFGPSCAPMCARCAGSTSSSTTSTWATASSTASASRIPAGQAVALVEARTFPPAEWDPHNVTACGEFFELTLPAQELERSSRFWQALGFAARRRRRGAARLAALGRPRRDDRPPRSPLPAGLELSLRRSRRALRLPARERAGVRVPAARLRIARQPSATLTAPEGTQLYLLEKGAQ